MLPRPRIRSKWWTLLWGLCLAALVNSAHHPGEIGFEHGNGQIIENRIRREMDHLGIPGLSVAVGFEDQVWSEGFGLADLENRVPVTPRTMFRLASVSKPITAVAAMQLYQAGKLELDAPVQAYVPEFPEKKWPVTTRHLLSHLAGIRAYRGDEIRSTVHYDDVIAPLAIFKDDPLQHEPGLRYVYSTYGFNLVGAVVERASKEPFLEYLRSHIFRPAGMAAIRDDDARAIIPNRAKGYRREKSGRLVNSDLADVSNKVPGGGLISTAEDLIHFATAVRDGKLLSREVRTLMWTDQKSRRGPTRYGFGWKVMAHNGRQEIYHTGAQPQVSTILYYQPDSGVIVALMANLEGVELLDLARSIAGIVSPATPLSHIGMAADRQAH